VRVSIAGSTPASTIDVRCICKRATGSRGLSFGFEFDGPINIVPAQAQTHDQRMKTTNTRSLDSRYELLSESISSSTMRARAISIRRQRIRWRPGCTCNSYYQSRCSSIASTVHQSAHIHVTIRDSGVDVVTGNFGVWPLGHPTKTRVVGGTIHLTARCRKNPDESTCRHKARLNEGCGLTNQRVTAAVLTRTLQAGCASPL